MKAPLTICLLVFFGLLRPSYSAVEIISELLDKGKEACKMANKADESEINSEEKKLVLESLKIRYCQKGKREIPYQQVNSWIKSFFIELNSEIANELKDHKNYVKYKIELVDFFRTQKEKEEFLIALRKKYSKEKHPKLFNQIHTKLLEVSPRYISKPQPKEYIKVGDDYRKNGDYKKAYYFLNRAFQKLKLSPKENYKLSIKVANVTKALRGYRSYIPKTEAYIKFFRGKKDKSFKDAYFDHSINLIRAKWTIGHPRTALKIALRLQKDFPKFEMAYLNWLISKIYEDTKDYKKQYQRTIKALEQLKTEETKHFQTILFDIATYSYEKKDQKLYQSILEQDLSKIKFERDIQRLKYWKARLLDDLKNNKEAKKLYTEIIDMNPIGYYALLSSEKTGHLPKITIKEISTNKLPEHLWFLKINSHRLRQAYLKQIKYVDSEFNNALIIAKIMQNEGLYYESFKFLYEFPQEDLIRALKQYPKLFYPLAFKGLLKDRPVNQYLALAIIKRESLFNPDAQSVANAIGLMQVLPSVGKQMNRKIKRTKELFDPKTNIDVGTKYIARVLKRFDRNLVLSIAAYNAGPRRVKTWKKKNIFSEDLDESIEKIPYMETRKYVKKVVRNYLNYKRIYDDDFSLDDLKILVKN